LVSPLAFVRKIFSVTHSTHARFLLCAGAHVVAPSDMMDGRIGAIKAELKRAQMGSKVSMHCFNSTVVHA
jgi:delta-aminolevulinic acid dehydratase/porphobilinogen synthase